MTRSLGDHLSLDGRVTGQTRLACTRIDLPFILIASVRTVGRDIVADTRSAGFDRTCEHPTKGRCNRLTLVSRYAPRRATGPHPSEKQRFVCIDISHPRANGLIEEHRLDCDATASIRQEEKLARHAKRIFPESIQARVALARFEPLHLPEFPYVSEEDLWPSPLEFDAQVGMFVGLEVKLCFGRERSACGRGEKPYARRFAREELARHSQMQEKTRATLESRNDVFPCPIEAEDRLSLEGSAQLLRWGEKEIAIGRRLDALDTPSNQDRCDLATRRLYLGQFGHGCGIFSARHRASYAAPSSLDRAAVESPSRRMGNRFGSVQVMLPHRPFGEPSPPKPPPKGRRRNTQPMDLAWLEERALRYASRWEASAAGVATLLERKIFERCERTGESSDAVREMIPELVAKLVDRGYVDDRRFAIGVLEGQRRRGASTVRIRARLAGKGIAESLLDELLAEEHPEIEVRSAWKLARRQRLGPYCVDPAERPALRDRHLGVFSRQGFEYETALEIVDADGPPDSI